MWKTTNKTTIATLIVLVLGLFFNTGEGWFELWFYVMRYALIVYLIYRFGVAIKTKLYHKRLKKKYRQTGVVQTSGQKFVDALNRGVTKGKET